MQKITKNNQQMAVFLLMNKKNFHNMYKLKNNLDKIDKTIMEDTIEILSFGGSGGAKKINKIIASIMLILYATYLVYLFY